MTLSKTEFWPVLVKKCLISIIFSLTMMPLVSKADKKTLLVQYAPGEIMQLIAPVTEPEKRALRDRYFEQNAETARKHGYRQEGVLLVEETLSGDFSPNVFVISRWPSLKAQKTFQALPSFSGVKALRREAWEALRLYDHELPDVLSLEFSQDKAYTIAFAWENPSNPGDYAEYLASLPPLLDKIGGRLMHNIEGIVLSAHNPHALAPQYISFIEWDAHDGIQQLQALPEFAELTKKQQSGTVRYELYRVSPRI